MIGKVWQGGREPFGGEPEQTHTLFYDLIWGYYVLKIMKVVQVIRCVRCIEIIDVLLLTGKILYESR